MSRAPAPLRYLYATAAVILFAVCLRGSPEFPRDLPEVILDRPAWKLAELKRFSLELGCLGAPSGPIGGR